VVHIQSGVNVMAEAIRTGRAYETTLSSQQEIRASPIRRDRIVEQIGKAEEHRFIQRTTQEPKIAEIKLIAAYILNCYTGKDYRPKQWENEGLMNWSWKEHEAKKEVSLRFTDVVSHIQADRTFDAGRFDFPSPPNNWLDSGVAVAKPDAPIRASDGSRYAPFVVPLQFGPHFPVKPCIDREGVAFSAFQGIIQANIVRLHRTLIDNCPMAIDLDGLSWFHDLRMLLNECVTVIDITLHQIYTRAEVGPCPPRWRFDPLELGLPHEVRLTEKLKWIGKITGKPLHDARNEVVSFLVIKDIRNHWNHFDPPCVAYTIEDVVTWLNRVSDIGRLLWKMRIRMGAPLSKGIVEMITLPLVEFVPRDPSVLPLPQGPDVGYSSSTWPSAALSAAAHDPEKYENQTYDVQEARSDKIIVRVLS